MRMACSVASAVSGSAGAAGQTLWASSMTSSSGRRSRRRSHRPREHALGDERLLLARRQRPGSTTRQRARGRRGRRAASRRRRAPTRPGGRGRGWRPAARAAAPRRVGGGELRRGSRGAPLGEQRAQLGVLLAVGDRVEPQQRGLGLRRRARRSAAAAARRPATRADRTRMPRRQRASARRAPAPRPRAARPAARSPSWGRGPRCAGPSPAAAARAAGRANSSCPSPTARTGTCGGRSRPRRAVSRRPAERQLPDGQARARGRGARLPRAHLLRRRRAGQVVVERHRRRGRGSRPSRGPGGSSAASARRPPSSPGSPTSPASAWRARASAPGRGAAAIAALEHHVAAGPQLEARRSGPGTRSAARPATSRAGGSTARPGPGGRGTCPSVPRGSWRSWSAASRATPRQAQPGLPASAGVGGQASPDTGTPHCRARVAVPASAR